NLRIHKMEWLEEMIVSRGARVEYLPPYSPDMNPIEMMWSVIKLFVRLFPCRSRDEMKKLIEIGLSLIEQSATLSVTKQST
ncbi:MAG: transposase, partial [Thermostichus sp. HHBFW_bins_43]